MTNNETEKRKVLLVHLWTRRAKDDTSSSKTGTINWLIQPVTKASGGVVFGLRVKDEAQARNVVNQLFGIVGTTEVSDQDDVIVVTREYTSVAPFVPLMISRYPVRVISMDYPTLPTAAEILSSYRGRLNKTLRKYRGEAL